MQGEFKSENLEILGESLVTLNYIESENWDIDVGVLPIDSKKFHIDKRPPIGTNFNIVVLNELFTVKNIPLGYHFTGFYENPSDLENTIEDKWAFPLEL